MMMSPALPKAKLSAVMIRAIFDRQSIRVYRQGASLAICETRIRELLG